MEKKFGICEEDCPTNWMTTVDAGGNTVPFLFDSEEEASAEILRDFRNKLAEVMTDIDDAIRNKHAKQFLEKHDHDDLPWIDDGVCELTVAPDGTIRDEADCEVCTE